MAEPPIGHTRLVLIFSLDTVLPFAHVIASAYCEPCDQIPTPAIVLYNYCAANEKHCIREAHISIALEAYAVSCTVRLKPCHTVLSPLYQRSYQTAIES